MMRLGNRTDPLNQFLPTLPFVGAVKDLTIRGAGKQGKTTLPHIHGQGLHVAPDMLRQALV